MIARYDLSNKIASFDFYSWLVIAAAMGATEIVFGIEGAKTNKWSAEVVRKRFETIIQHGPALLGLKSRIGEGGEDLWSPHLRELINFARAGNKFPRLRSVLPPGKEKYTVTLRRDERVPHRNSNEVAWRDFAAEIGAFVIEDYDVDPIGLHERMALYAGAEMNFGVPNGPMHLVLLSDYPMMMFDCQKCEGAFKNYGIEFGSQYPWSSPDQRLIWEPDDLPNLRKHFAIWKDSSP